MKKYIKKSIPAVLLALVFSATIFLFSGCSGAIDTVLSQAANQANADCPQMVDSITRLDSVKAKTGKVLEYSYTLVGYNTSNLSSAQLSTMKTALQTSVLSNLKTNSSLDDLKKLGVTFRFVYNGDDGKSLFELQFAPNDYK